jgi:ABC-type histidine transport system ATPase subunit
MQQTLNAMRDLGRTGMTMIVVTPRGAVRRRRRGSDRVHGRRLVVEHGQPAEIIHNPRHERTKAFMQRIAAPLSHR